MTTERFHAESTTFLIVQEDVVVAEDIAQIIQSVCPHARIVNARTLPKAAAALRGMAAPAMAFVAAAPVDIARCEFVLRGACVVLMGHAAEMAHGGWPVLRFPFTTDDVQAHLARCMEETFAA